MKKFKFNKVDYRKISAYKDVDEKDFYNWKWQMKNSVRDIESLKKIIDLNKEEIDGAKVALDKFRMSFTPYYLSLVDSSNPICPIKLQAIPQRREIEEHPFDLEDPLHEDVDSPVPGLTHRYPDRVLLVVTQICSMYCRHCTRRRMVGDVDQHINESDFDKAIEYIKANKEIRDVIISGGDPLVLSDNRIESILKKIYEIEHVEMIRIGSRTPVVMPMRITDELCEILAKYHPVYLNTHFNHPNEITEDSAAACNRLNNYGINIHNQSVLLKDINDCPHVMKHLVHDLMKIRVKPYYIYQCDLSEGIFHFRTPVARGMQIIESLRGHTSGMAIPTFVVDAPGGGGKIPLMPNYMIVMSGDKVILRNFEGNLCTYHQPFAEGDYCGHHPECNDPKYQVNNGPAWMLSEGGPLTLETESKRLERLKKRQK